MPMLHFRKRRQPDATAKPPRPVNVNVDVEPLPRASKFKNMVDSRRASTMFRSSGGDLRRAAHPSRGDLRQDQAATRTASATIKLAPEVPSLPRQDVRPESMRCTSGESSVDGHSEAYVPTRTKRLDSSPMLTPPVASPDDVASITATVGTPAGERGPGLSIVAPSAALAARELDTVLAQADGILSASPTSAVFATPPQRASEDAFSPSPRALSTAFPTDAAVAVTTPAVTRPIPPKNERTISSLSALSNPPGSPRKLSLVIQSAPMPLPIANLPVLTPTSPTVATAWGELARMGGPKSPARSRTGSMQGGFSWPASRAAAPATEGNEDLSEADLHSVTKTMVSYGSGSTCRSAEVQNGRSR
jgi:hypothetical protein